MSRWTAADIPDQTGRVVIVTGGNSGLGLITARELANAGAYVVIAAPSLEQSEAVRTGPLAGDDRSEARVLDLADPQSVRAFADGLADWRIDALVNNAGIMATPEQRTPAGYDLQFAVNVLGHFLLTSLLLPRITDRVVWLSSLTQGLGRLDEKALAQVETASGRYDNWQAYSESKLADLVLAYELQRRLLRVGSTVRSIAAHPGYSATALHGHTETWLDRVTDAIVPRIGQPPEMGALPTLFATTVPDLPGGSFIGPDGFRGMRGHPRPVGSSARSHDRELGARLWERCEEWTGSGPWPT